MSAAGKPQLVIQTLALAQREVTSLLRMPVGWVVIALFAFLTGLVFVTSTLIPTQPASMRSYFGLAGWLLLPVAPAITMRTLSEEYRTGTIETLMTSPVTALSVVLGKYVGCITFLLIMLVPSLGLLGILFAVATPKPDAGPIVAGYLCLVLMGSVYLSIGMLASSMTSNQTLAYLGTLFALLFLLLLPGIPLEHVPEWLGSAITSASLHGRAADFSRGLIDTGHVAFFAAIAGFFVAMAWLALSARRWA